MAQTTAYDIPKVQYDKDGRSYITVYGKIDIPMNYLNN